MNHPKAWDPHPRGGGAATVVRVTDWPYRRIRVAPMHPKVFYRASNSLNGEILECADLAELFRRIAMMFDPATDSPIVTLSADYWPVGDPQHGD